MSLDTPVKAQPAPEFYGPTDRPYQHPVEGYHHHSTWPTVTHLLNAVQERETRLRTARLMWRNDQLALATGQEELDRRQSQIDQLQRDVRELMDQRDEEREQYAASVDMCEKGALDAAKLDLSGTEVEVWRSKHGRVRASLENMSSEKARLESALEATTKDRDHWRDQAAEARLKVTHGPEAALLRVKDYLARLDAKVANDMLYPAETSVFADDPHRLLGELESKATAMRRANLTRRIANGLREALGKADEDAPSRPAGTTETAAEAPTYTWYRFEGPIGVIYYRWDGTKMDLLRPPNRWAPAATRRTPDDLLRDGNVYVIHSHSDLPMRCRTVAYDKAVV